MQDLSSFVKTQSPLSVGTQAVSSKKGTTTKSDVKNYFSLMLAQLAEQNATLKTEQKSTTNTPHVTKEGSKTNPVESKAKSVDDHLLEDILTVVDALKSSTSLPILPTLKSSSRIEKLINNEAALKELSDVKSISDVLALSKKYDLGLEKLTFSKESLESLEKAFPTLAKSAFFQTLTQEMVEKVEEKTSTTPASLSTATLSPLETKFIKKSETSENTSALKELLKTEDVVLPKVNEKQPPKEAKVSEKVTESEIKTQPQVLENSKKEISIPSIKSVEEKQPSSSVTQIQMVQQKSIVDEKPTKVEPLHVAPLSEEIEEELTPKLATTTRTSELKNELPQPNKGLIESVLQGLKTDKPLTNAVHLTENTSNQEKNVETPVPASVEIETQNAELNASQTVELKTSSKNDASSKTLYVPKESLNHFATDLKEKIEAYRPPVMKVELALNPKNLGEVDVTLLTRGNNLHVNISSNSQTMTLFTQNQAEFKSALINMGFTNLEMNFSDQRQSEQGHQQNKSSGTQFFEELSEETFTETAAVELIIPRYV